MEREKARQLLMDTGALLIGDSLVALGLVMFTVPNNIAPGGVSGLATALSYVSPVSIGIWTLLLNIPLMYLALRKLGWAPLIKTIASTVLLSLLIDLFGLFIPGYTNNVLLASVLGGVLFGVGMGLLFLRNASTGGTDLVSLLLNRRFPSISVGNLLLGVDATVVLIAVLVFKDIEVALYSIVTIWVTTKVIDSITQGVDYAKVMYVVTERGEDINKVLAGQMELGVTIWQAKGGFTNRDKEVLMLVLHRAAFAAVLGAVKAVDPNAFIFVSGATEVHGEGFKPIK